MGDHMYSYMFILAVILNFIITIGKVKQRFLSVSELVWGIIVWGVVQEPLISKPNEPPSADMLKHVTSFPQWEDGGSPCHDFVPLYQSLVPATKISRKQ